MSHERPTSFGERRVDDGLRAGQARPEVNQLAVAGDAPRVQALEHLGIRHAGCEARPQIRLSSSADRDSQTTDCRIGSGR